MTEHYTISTQLIDDPAGTLVGLSGEFDLDARDDLRDTLLGAVAEGRDVLVDFGAVTFLDSEALGALVIGFNQARATGIAFRLTGARGSARRVLETTGVLDLTGAD